MQGLPFARGYSELSPTYKQHQFLNSIVPKGKCKLFYLKLLNLSKRWKLKGEEGAALSPQVRSIDLTHSANLDNNSIDTKELVRESIASARWRKTHNYTGIYDMVYLKEKSQLVASVNDCIQVWDVSGALNNGGYKRINTITATNNQYRLLDLCKAI